MGFLLGVIQAAASALGVTLDRKVVAHRAVGAQIQNICYRSFQALILSPLFVLGALAPAGTYATILEPKNLLLLAASIGLLFATYPFRRAAYMNEKVTALQPFAMTKQIFSVVFAFAFVAQERQNVWPFVFSLAAVAVIVASQVGKDGFKVNKWSLTLTFGMFLLAAQSFFTMYFVKMVGGSAYYLTECVALVALTSAVAAATGQWRQAGLIKKKWTALVLNNSVLGLVSALIVLEIYRTRGMVASNLVQLLYVAFVFLFSTTLLKEKLTARDVVVSVLVTACVAAGAMMK